MLFSKDRSASLSLAKSIAKITTYILLLLSNWWKAPKLELAELCYLFIQLTLTMQNKN